jgi:integrase
MARKMKGVTFIERNGTKYWYARVYRRRVYCGKDDKGYKVAVAARAKHVARQYENREIAAGLRVKKVQFKTVTDLSNWYMQLPSVQKQSSYQSRISRCAHLLSFFGKKPVDQVGTEDQERYRVHRYQQGAAPGSVDNEISLLRTMYYRAKKAKKIHADAVPGEFVTENLVNPRRVITDGEFKELVGAAEGDFKDVLICGYETAMRLGEIVNLRANQVYLNVRHISGKVVDYIDLGIFDTKTQTRRTIPVSPRLKEVLKRRPKGLEPEGHVFTKNGLAGIPYGDKILNDKGERIGIVFHCLRHTRTTKWVEAGFSDEIIRRATGHRDMRAYQNYVKLDPAVVMRLVENGIKTAYNIHEAAL